MPSPIVAPKPTAKEKAKMTEREKRRKEIIKEETRKINAQLLEEKHRLDLEQSRMVKLQEDLLKKIENSRQNSAATPVLENPKNRSKKRDEVPLKSALRKLTRWEADDKDDKDDDDESDDSDNYEYIRINKNSKSSITKSIKKYRF